MVSLLLNVVIFDQCCSGTLLPWTMFELDELVVLFVLYQYQWITTVRVGA